MSAKTAAIWLGAISLVIGLLGLVPNPLIGSGAFFSTSTALDWERIIGGLLLIGAGLWSARLALIWLRVVAVLYVIGVLYTFAVTSMLSAYVGANAAGNWLRIVFGVLLVIAAIIARE